MRSLAQATSGCFPSRCPLNLGGDGATMAQVQQLLSVQEERLKKQNSEVLSQIAALATQLQSLKPA